MVHDDQTPDEPPRAVLASQGALVATGTQQLALPVPGEVDEEVAARRRLVTFRIDEKVRHDVAELRASPSVVCESLSEGSHLVVSREGPDRWALEGAILGEAGHERVDVAGVDGPQVACEELLDGEPLLD